MTGPHETLERSLRDGPPDEVGYLPQPLGTSDRMAASEGTRVVGIGGTVRLRPAQRSRTARRWQSALALLVVLGLVAGGIVYSMTHVGVGASPRATPIFAPLAETFTSPRNGFSVRYPNGWTVKPATASWPQNVFLPVGNPGLDQLTRPGTARLLVASQRLGSGQTAGEWLAAYFHPYQGAQSCGGDQSSWPRLPISGASGYLDANACPWSIQGRISDPDVWFDAIVFSGDRVYQIELDGNVDLSYFKAVLAALTLDPSTAID